MPDGRQTACNPLLLTSSEFKQVDDAKHARNLLACETGADECDPYLLDGAEAKEIANMQKSRTPLHHATADTHCDSSASVTSSDQDRITAAEELPGLQADGNRQGQNSQLPQ